MTRGKKFLFGCLGGCGFVILVFVGSCVGFTMWLNSPGEILDPGLLRGPETAGYVEWTLRLEDPGTAEFTEAMIQQMGKLNERGNSPLPDGLQQFLNARQMSSARKDMQRLFPIVLAWTARPGETTEEEEHLLSVSARGASHQMAFFDWMFGLFIGRADDVEIVRYKGEKIFTFSTSEGIQPAVFVRHGIGFITTDLDSARQTLDRLARPDDRGPANVEWQGLFDGVPEDQPLRGALSNRRGELKRVLTVLNLPEEHLSHAAWDEVSGATIFAGFVDGSIFAGAVELHGPDASWAAENAAKVGAGLTSLLEEPGIEFAIETVAAENRIRVEFSSSDLIGKIEDVAEKAGID